MTEPNTELVSQRTLIAFEPAELKESQESLLHWLTEKFNICLDEEKQFKQAAEIAKDNKWKNADSILAAARRASNRANYYDKAIKAVEEGYILIPPFPLSVFAVRTTRKKPLGNVVSYRSDIADAQPLPNDPPGEGEYVDHAVLYRHDEVKDAANPGKTIKRYWASNYDAVEFPMEAVKPEIMERASTAMALKIFDEIGLVGEARRDPILVGAILLKEGWNTKRMNFFLAWWIDKRSL